MKMYGIAQCPYCNDSWFYHSDDRVAYKIQCHCGFAYRNTDWTETKESLLDTWSKVVEQELQGIKARYEIIGNTNKDLHGEENYNTCNDCACNKICNHDIYGFMNCNNFIPKNWSMPVGG